VFVRLLLLLLCIRLFWRVEVSGLKT